LAQVLFGKPVSTFPGYALSRAIGSFYAGVRMPVLRACAALSLALIAVSAVPAQAAEFQELEIASKTGVHVFQVEMALTPEEHARGLMFRRELPDGQGMLFDFQVDMPVAFWMKNTYISLDMIFIRGDGRIQRVAERTEPLSERNIPSGGPVRWVLEVIAGTAKKIGIAAGDQVGGAALKGR
jgi:uncharacterized membrane protein (UPF0127 family)